jgi:hypothetical protein
VTVDSVESEGQGSREAGKKESFELKVLNFELIERSAISGQCRRFKF